MIILASKSPRRRELLAQIGVNFTYKVSDIDESALDGESAEALVIRLASAKAQAVYSAANNAEAIVIGSDTVVSIGQNILGKPASQAHAIDMLTLLSGQTHQVFTAVTLIHNGQQHSVNVPSHVTFREITPAEIRAYWKTGEPADKAGAYAIQGLAAQFITHLQGSYSAVMGLPLYETAQLLKQAGVSLLDNKEG